MDRVRGLYKLQRTIPLTIIHIDITHFHSMVLGIANDLGGFIESHRLAVEEGSSEGGGVVAFKPGGNINQKCKAGGVRFRKSIFAKAFDLFKTTFGKIYFITALNHTFDHATAVELNIASMPKGCHCAPETIGFARREACSHNCDLHRLLLEQWDAFGFPQDFSEVFGWVFDFFFIATPA